MNSYKIDRERVRREELFEKFRLNFGAFPKRLFSSPDRAELCGAETESNRGTSVFAALDSDLLCAVSEREDGIVEIYSEFDPVRFSVNDLGSREREKGKLIALARGVLEYLRRSGRSFGGFSACMQSLVREKNLSASFEVLVAEVINRLYLNGALSPLEKAKAAKFAENVYFGRPCLLAPRAAIALGGVHHFDFLKGEPSITSLPIPKGSLVLVQREKDEPAKTGEILSFFGKTSLRELSREEIEASLPGLRKTVSDASILRALSFFEECDRADLAARALLDGKFDAFLRRMDQTDSSFLCFSSLRSVLALELMKKRNCAVRPTGEGEVLAFLPSDEKLKLFSELLRVFGRENVFSFELREEGAFEIDLNEN